MYPSFISDIKFWRQTSMFDVFNQINLDSKCQHLEYAIEKDFYLPIFDVPSKMLTDILWVKDA